MANTLDLDPEWGGIDLIEEIEAAFGIKVADDEAERWWTVGDVYEAICRYTPNWEMHAGSCASSMVFYRVRRSLTSVGEVDVSPSSPLTHDISADRLFKTIHEATGLRLPWVELTAVGMTGGVLCMIGFIGGIVALLVGEWTAGAIGALMFALGIVLLRFDPARLPSGVVTVGDLVRRTAPLNVQKLVTDGGRRPDRWSVLVALAAEYGTLPPEEIGPDTFLLRKGMEIRGG